MCGENLADLGHVERLADSEANKIDSLALLSLRLGVFLFKTGFDTLKLPGRFFLEGLDFLEATEKGAGGSNDPGLNTLNNFNTRV